MTLFDLNKMPYDQEEKMPEEEVTTPRPSNAPNGAQNTPLLGPWRNDLSPSEVASLNNRVQPPSNPHRVETVIARHAEGSTANHGWIQWLAPAPYRPLPALLRAATDVASAFSDPRQQGSHIASLQQDVASQTTIASVDDENSSQPSETNGGSQGSGTNGGTGELSAWEIHRKSVREGKRPMTEVEPEPITGTEEHVDSTEYAPPSTEAAPTSALLHSTQQTAHAEQYSGSSSQQRGENQAESSEHPNSVNMGAELLDHLAREILRKAREAAFRAQFNFATLRCKARRPCVRCLPFWKLAQGAERLGESRGRSSRGVREDLPPVLKNVEVGASAPCKPKRRYGPMNRSCNYRGVTAYKRTGRWESHIWHRARQVFLGACATKEEAARNHDKAAVLIQGTDADINFLAETYQQEINYLYKLNTAQLTIYLRRDSRGFGATLGHVGVRRLKNRLYEASIPKKTKCEGCPQTTVKEVIGTFPSEEEAARFVYSTAVTKKCKNLERKCINTHHVMGMQSYIKEWYAAVAPEEMKDLILLQKQTKSSKKGKKGGESSKNGGESAPKKGRKAKKAKTDSPDSSTQDDVSSSSTPPSPTAASEPAVHPLPPVQIKKPCNCGCSTAPKQKQPINPTSKKTQSLQTIYSTAAAAVAVDSRDPPLSWIVSSRRARKARSPKKHTRK